MPEPIIVWKKRDPLGSLAPAQFEARLKSLLADRVKAAYFFGSYGTEAFSSDSDVDLLLVVDTERAFLERALDFGDILDLVPAMDLLVYTPEEFDKLTREPTVGFWTSVVASLRRFL